jgi:hypothetical protein
VHVEFAFVLMLALSVLLFAVAVVLLDRGVGTRD